mgnify:CR=1 FL=1|jgi:phosphoribosylaminoimidazole-succinocarboxamide synthase
MTQLPEILYRGSVKDIRAGFEKDDLIFQFSDRYSVFDWGEMPDTLPEKGAALAMLAWLFFDLLKQRGINSHMTALLDQNGAALSGEDIFTQKTPLLSVEKMDVLRPAEKSENGKLSFDYSAYDTKPAGCLVPLEVIFRYAVPEGSSLLKRAGDADYCKSLGLDTPPKAGDVFAAPVIEFSTKLENYDRYLTYDEAQKISGMNDAEFSKLQRQMKTAAATLHGLFADIGIDLLDGKLEFGFAKETDADGNRNFVLIDSIGPDELRLTYNGTQLSKEVLRKFYRGSDWEQAVEKAKKLADQRGVADWKTICVEELQQTPPVLDPALKTATAMIYKSIARALAEKFYQKSCFDNAWSLNDVAGTLDNWGKKHAA